MMNNSLEFLNCVFEENEADYSGVAQIISHNGIVIFRYCVFIKNSAYSIGSVLSLAGSVDIVLQNFFCQFIENDAYIIGINHHILIFDVV